VGLTGITFTNVFNACATAASAIQQDCRHPFGLGSTTSALPSAWTSIRAARSPTIPRSWRCRSGTPTTAIRHHQVLRIKANHSSTSTGISEETLAQGGHKNFRNGSKDPNAFRRKEISVEDIMRRRC